MGAMIHLRLQPMEGSSVPLTSSTTTSSISSVTTTPYSRLIFPHTSEDWKYTMDEIKKLYLTGEYKQCTARCIQILKGIKDPYRVHPLHSLYLSFYCATCLEITASDLHSNSPERLSLLRESLIYFQKAEEYIQYADIPIDSNNLMLNNRNSSTSSTSSARSSVDSVFSSTSFPSTTDGLSPVFSTCSFEGNDENTLTRIRTLSECSAATTQSTQSTDTATATAATAGTPAPLRIKKKVSFSPGLPTLISKPHLNIDSSITETVHRPIQQTTTPPRPIISPKYQSPSPAQLSLNTHLTNYNLNLSAFTNQLTYHITHINNQIEAIQIIRKSRRSNQASFAPSLFNSSSDLNEEVQDELKKRDIRERIQKLRSACWKGKRWDGSKYEALREKVENELNGWI